MTTKIRKTRRRGNGEGSIFKRGDGRWVATITVGRNSSGNRIRRTIYGSTRAEVQDELRKLLNHRANGTLGGISTETVGEYLTRWLKDVVQDRGIRPNTQLCYEQTVNLYIVPQIGGIKLQKLTRLDVRTMQGELQRAGKSARACELARSVLSVALEDAIELDLVTHNACSRKRKKTRTARKEKGVLVVLDQRQARRFLLKSRHDRQPALHVLAVTSGMRQGEIFGLQWPDIDFDNGNVTVRQQLIEIRGKLSLAPPKSDSGCRTFKLTALALAALLHHRETVKESTGVIPTRGYVFTDSHGGPMRKSNFTRKSFKPLLKAASLPDIRFHDLRHTAATLALAAGVPPHVVQQQLGHADVQITLNTYAHVLPAMQVDAATRIDGVFPAKFPRGYNLAVRTDEDDSTAQKETPQTIAG